MSLSVVCKQVSRIYQQGEIQVTALNQVNLVIERGSFVSLCGPSGSGKTTLLNLIGGLDLPSSGEVTVADQKIHLMSRGERADFRLQNIGFVFQAYNLIPVLSARENVEFVMQLQGVPAADREERSKKILEAVGLGAMMDRRPGQLSGGQQQRVAVARAIVSEPSLVLADEPTANLDSKTAQSLLELMREMNEQRGITFIFSTHDALVMQYAKRLVRLQDGRIESDEVR